MVELITLDIPKRDINILLAGLKIAEINAGVNQQWEVAKRMDKLHRFLIKQAFNYEEVKED